jgi:hypothetical protein
MERMWKEEVVGQCEMLLMTKESNEMSRDNRRPCRGSNRAPPEYKSEELTPEPTPTFSVTI